MFRGMIRFNKPIHTTRVTHSRHIINYARNRFIFVLNDRVSIII
jgi:hypothetical protein